MYRSRIATLFGACRRASTIELIPKRMSSVMPDPSMNKIKPAEWEKRFLVRYGFFKTKEEIPETIPLHMHSKMRNKFRIAISNYSMGFCLVVCLVLVYFAKEAEKRGESVQKWNMEWHEKINAEARAEAAKKD